MNTGISGDNSRFLAVAFALIGALFICGCEEKKGLAPVEPIVSPVKILTVNALSEAAQREYPGKVRATQRVKLAFQVTGRIISFPIKCGDRVKTGQVLGELDPRDFENALKSATATYEEAKKDFERHAKLLEKSIVSTEAFDAKKKAYEVADANMKTAAKALEDTKLNAPFDGIVAGTYVDNYQNIQAHEPVLSLQDISQIEIISNVPEKDVIRADVQTSLEEINGKFSLAVQFPALGEREFPVRLKEFETEADSTTQTFKTITSMQTPPDINIMPGMTAMLKVRKKGAASHDAGFWIPSAAVMEDNNGGKYVWVVGSELKVSKRSVSIGDLKEDSIFILEGLSKGERIATTGGSLLADGMKVMELVSVDGRKLSNRSAPQQ